MKIKSSSETVPPSFNRILFIKVKGLIRMPSKKPQFVIRTEKEILDKIAYIAHENERNSTQEIVYLIKQRIKSYEKEHGEIIIEEESRKEAWEMQKETIKNRKENSIKKTLKDSFNNGYNFGNAKK
ncbi:MAG: Arc family DNA-binding protein [Lachnoclostridium edouardi]|nr:Arc family DNA-binding protein [Lachnoclostridium edouardi]